MTQALDLDALKVSYRKFLEQEGERAVDPCLWMIEYPALISEIEALRRDLRTLRAKLDKAKEALKEIDELEQ